MPKEKEDYRANLELLQQLYPGAAAISLPEAARVVGMKPDRYRADQSWPRFYTGKHARVSLASLARRMS